MDIQQITKIAEYHFKNLRTNCKFKHIYSYKKFSGGYRFTACYQCKKGRKIKSISVTKDGVIVK